MHTYREVTWPLFRVWSNEREARNDLIRNIDIKSYTVLILLHAYTLRDLSELMFRVWNYEREARHVLSVKLILLLTLTLIKISYCICLVKISRLESCVTKVFRMQIVLDNENHPLIWLCNGLPASSPQNICFYLCNSGVLTRPIEIHCGNISGVFTTQRCWKFT